MKKNTQTSNWLENYNDYEVSAPEGMIGDGLSNVGRNSSPAWGGQFQNGGKAPKYVESKNDPRYKAYQDSLALYDFQEKVGGKSSKWLKSVPKNKKGMVSEKDWENYSKRTEKFTSKKELDKQWDAFNRLTKLNKKEPGKKYPFKQELKILPNGFDTYVSDFEKPQQQVIVKPTTTKQTTKPSNTEWTPLTKEIAKGRYEGDLKNMVYKKRPDGKYDITYQAPPEVSRQPVKGIQNNLQPEGLVHDNLDIEAELPEIRQQVKHPKSWKYNKIEGGSEESGYINSPEDFEYYIKLKNLYEDKEHKDWLGTKNKIDITPQYQMGGNLPGAVGNMYARTGSPSKGPRRNQTDVTDASAQNGKEMQYYQQGLDWKPKSISRDGAWLDQYDVAQTGTKKFKLKDERELAYKPAESTNVKKKNFDLEQSKSNKSYINQLAAQQKEDKRRKALTKDQREREDYNARNEERGSIQAPVKESKWDRTKAIVSNPLTAFGYAARNESLPTRFQHGERNTLDNAIDWINPLQGVAALSEIPGELSRGEYLNAGLSALDAVDLGVYAKGAIKASKPLLQKGVQQLRNIPTSISPELRQGLQTAGPSFGSRLQEHIRGLDRGIVDLAKGRPFFETFPITQAQKKASDIIQDQAKDEGVDFVNNWFYKNGQLRPEVENRIDNIYLTEPHYGTGAKNNNPLSITKNKLVSTRSKDLPFENISDDSREYIEANRGKIGGFNSEPTNESITFRNMGMYRLPAQEIKNTVVHEAGHTAQKIGDYIPWGTMTTDYSPEFKYFTSNPDTNIGKRFKNALRTPRKTSGDNYAHRTWQSSPNELHSELMSARSNLYDKFLKQGIAPEEAMDLLQNPGDETLDALHKIGGLDQFYKKSRWGKSRVPMETKRDLMRILPAAVPLTVGAGALQQKKDGGIIKDDRGQWDHPGEITEINSNDITMEGVPYDVLGISDTGDTKLMKPGKNYKFKGKKVTEYPMAKNGVNQQDQKTFEQLDQLTNFTNYNKPTIGGWLNKYN